MIYEFFFFQFTFTELRYYLADYMMLSLIGTHY